MFYCIPLSANTHIPIYRSFPAQQDLSTILAKNHNNAAFQICNPTQMSVFCYCTIAAGLTCIFKWKNTKKKAGLYLNVTCELQIRATLRGAIEETRGTEDMRRWGCGSQITSFCLSILSWLSPAQPGSIDFVWGLERPTASDYLGEWAVLCK